MKGTFLVLKMSWMCEILIYTINIKMLYLICRILYVQLLSIITYFWYIHICYIWYYVWKTWKAIFACPCMITRCAWQSHMDQEYECDLECIPAQCPKVLMTAFIFVPSFRSAPSICLCTFPQALTALHHKRARKQV